ncbi:hypothetical protein NE857_33130 [Nocardiopsis exhalans]|uniref:Uncharacterized protein n=1 Tax=Nocardiopsis exhalans TaxID=163604 RepID=A0ABY5D919_9ACTN|nr:hypothetical protein [Nocardiopsis exhalans]USY20013.1 hypothetical protein NE857_33130 [Nocardiopsis exhalans]
MKSLKSLAPIPGDNLLLADTEKPALNRVRASRTRRRFHAVLLVLLVLAACVSLAAGDIADIGDLWSLLLLAFLGLLAPVLYLITRLNQISRMSLPYRLLDERQRGDRDDAHRFGQRMTSAMLGLSFVLSALITIVFSPGGADFPGWLVLPLLWLLVMAHTMAPALYLAWTQPDELPEEDDDLDQA